jgi:hypothetical protein
MPSSQNEAAIQALVPKELSHFLLILLTGEVADKVVPQCVQWLIDSFSQDLVYAVSCGRQKTPKHILLGSAVKTLTGNVELIQSLNRLGHCISYSQIEENETALCLQKLSLTAGGNIALPGNIYPCVSTTVAWDNIDFQEETRTGAGTSHRVNGIIVQPLVYGPQLPKQKSDELKRNKQRSLKLEHNLIPIYNSGPRTGPGTIECELIPSSTPIEIASKQNLFWFIIRQTNTENQTICGWTGFNISIRQGVEVQQNTIGYLPTIHSPATDMATSKEILKEAMEIKRKLNLNQLVLVFDQALYAKVSEVLWKEKSFYDGIILRMGTFHTICNLLGIIGKRFEDSGLRDLIIESGIIAEGSVGPVMEGRQYNRAVRIHKYVYEALLRVAWKGFMPWIVENHPEKKDDIEQALELIEDFREDISQYSDTFSEDNVTSLIEIFCKYLLFLKHDNGDLSSYWISYIEIVGNILLGLIRASREGDWDLHLAVINQMIPWCFAYDKINYARYLPVYLAQMCQLETKYPEIYKYMKEGGFSVQLGNSSSFARIPVDQTTEETVNKDSKIPGGIRNYSLKAGAVDRFYLGAEYKSAFLRNFREMLCLNKSTNVHNELQKSRILKDEVSVSAVVDTIYNWNNPFEKSQDLISLSTATVVPKDITLDILNAEKVGQAAYEQFKKDRLINNEMGIKFNDPIKKNGLKTFSNMVHVKKKVKTTSKEIILSADRRLFGQMLLIAQTRKDLQMKDVFCHPLGPVPWSLAASDGSPRKTNKAVLMRALQKDNMIAENIPSPSTTVIDGMTLIQRLNGDQKSFADIGLILLKMALNEGQFSDRIDIVFDVYKQVSIKHLERKARCHNEQSVEYSNINSSHIVRQWRKFLTNTRNKKALVAFLIKEWSQPHSIEIIGNKTLYVTLEEKCLKIFDGDPEPVQELESTHEEADTRIFLHVAHAAKSRSAPIMIASVDTDVFLLGLAFASVVNVPLFQKSGTSKRCHYVDIRKAAQEIGDGICKAILGFHAFTGCDSVSAFAGRGKLSTLKRLKQSPHMQNVFSSLGEHWKVEPDLYNNLRYLPVRCMERQLIVLAQMTCGMECLSARRVTLNRTNYPHVPIA